MFGINRGHMASAMKYLGFSDLARFGRLASGAMAYNAYKNTRAAAVAAGVEKHPLLTRVLGFYGSHALNMADAERIYARNLGETARSVFRNDILGMGLPVSQRIARGAMVGGLGYGYYRYRNRRD